MNEIDQAFINAYADEMVTTKLPSTPRYAVREPGPALRVFTKADERESSEYRVDQPRRGVSASRARSVVDKAPETYSRSAARPLREPDSTDELALPSLVGECRPLSAFATQKLAPAKAFKPVFEVDEFRWPAIVDHLVSASVNLFAPVVDILLAAALEGRTLVGIAGANNRVGASTVAMCLARAVASSGHSIALVDGNFLKGDLACALGLEFDQGWHDVLAGNIPLAESAVASLRDKITLIPLSGPAEDSIERLSSIQSSVVAGMLRYHHDLVLFDLGAATDPAQFDATRGIFEHCRLDAGIVVATVGACDPITAHGTDRLNSVFGPLGLGVIGNRAS